MKLEQMLEGVKTVHPKYSASAEQYANVQGEIQHQINVLQDKLLRHADRAQGDPTNWGYIGDITHIMNQLVSINEFMK